MQEIIMSNVNKHKKTNVVTEPEYRCRHGKSSMLHAPCSERKRRLSLSRVGENLIARMYQGLRMHHTCAFDIKNDHMLIEVKTMRIESKDHKVHISQDAFERKLAMAKELRMNSILVVVLVYSEKYEVYECELKQSVRVNQMKKVKVIMRN